MNLFQFLSSLSSLSWVVCVCFFCYSFSSLLVTMLMRIIGKLNNSCATNTMKSEYNVFQFNNCHESDILPWLYLVAPFLFLSFFPPLSISILFILWVCAKFWLGFHLFLRSEYSFTVSRLMSFKMKTMLAENWRGWKKVVFHWRQWERRIQTQTKPPTSAAGSLNEKISLNDIDKITSCTLNGKCYFVQFETVSKNSI